MKRNLLAVAVAASLLSMGGCGFIDTGNVGVETRFGQVNAQEVQPGFYTAILSSVDEFNVKEASMDLNDLKPKAKDNLSLQDLDISVYYTVNPNQVADLYIKYAGQHERAGWGPWYPAWGVVSRTVRDVVYGEVAKHDSLTLHTKRDELANNVLAALQVELDKDDKGTFTVTKVLIRALNTDASIEASIQKNVQAQKDLEQKATQVEIAKKDAEIEVARARGIAESQRIINSTLTKEYLQHEQNKAMLKFAESGQSTTVMFPYGTQMNTLVNLGK